MITRFGMSESFGMVALEEQNNRYLGGDTTPICSAETQTEIDKQVVEKVKSLYGKASDILIQNRAKLDELAHYLYANETITGEEFTAILNS
jgi:cell division protease FtsH